jgi:tripartite-type tricarboxylate transporter receptor subunit TctC
MGLILSTVQGFADGYPSGPIRLIIPYAPGGATDNLGRLVAKELASDWSTTVVVVNKPGANGIVGANEVAKSQPDGQTLLLVVPGHVINPSIYPNSPYDVIRDFAPITEIATSPWLVVTNKSLPVANLQELIALAKSQPGKLSFGSSEPSSRLAGELFKQVAGVNIVNVPYRGASEVMVDLLGGRIQVAFTTSLSVGSLYRAGKVRALAVAGKSRLVTMPDVPTAAEAGLPGYETAAWYGLYAHARTSKDIISKIQKAVAAVLKRKQILDQLNVMGATPLGTSPEEFSAFTKSEFLKYAKIVKDANIKAGSN